ncbi:MAG TPA: NADH:ubiquinone reductase (Na(+)-transporting) subunit B [Bacteroidales bacterium]|nr:NADH:ubiquinone reductase (Na(+)-transporting) subunit B [Bacteroidales bacterium]
MKALIQFVEKNVQPQFEKGGKFAKFHRSFEAFQTFLYVKGDVTLRGSHIRDAIDMKRTMFMVIIALMPALLFGIWNVGFQHYRAIGLEETLLDQFWFGLLRVLPLIIVSYVSGLAVEFIFAEMRNHEVNEGFLVSGMLIPLIIPVTTPLWMVALATIFAVIIGKEVFGGTGMNIVNPALLARAFLFFAYPAQLSGEVWIDTTLREGQQLVDGFSGATPLAMLAINETQYMPSLLEMFIGTIPGSIGETSTLAILIGAVILVISGVGSFRIMASVIIGGLAMGGIFNLVGINDYMLLPAYYHLVLGGFMFGAVFMATDPVTASQTATGKYIYGLLIGVVTVLVRVLNPAYPEGMMLAILLMNVFAPLIDHYVVEANIKRRLKRLKAVTVQSNA